MNGKILAVLKKSHGFVSGEELSERLKVTRQALWKHIQELKDDGYEISAVPHIGYRLDAAPDRLFPSEVGAGLGAKLFGRKVYYFDVLPSTMDSALSLGMQKAPEGTVVIAESQAKGRGRMGREWSSPKYKGIYFSLILRPGVSANQAPVLTLLAAVSVCEAVKEVTGVEASIKWPNDVLIDGNKLGGILTELHGEMDEVGFVVVGIGLNVNAEKKDLPAHATSLREAVGVPVSRVDLLQALLRRMEARYQEFKEKGPAPVVRDWKALSVTLGRRVRVQYHRSVLEGEAADLDVDGALLVRDDAGILRRVTAGDVLLLPVNVN